MIASLRGTVIDKGLDSVVIECGGVGYLCRATADTLAALPRDQDVFVLTTMVVREESQTLYAFGDAATREVFARLQSVSGVGARLALGVMSVLRPGELARAVADGDVKSLQRAPGVGKRLAERMAVDLKGKLDEYASAPPGAGTDDGAGSAGHTRTDSVAAAAPSGQVVEALIGLGFTEGTAESTVLTLEPSDAQTMLRQALASLGRQR